MLKIESRPTKPAAAPALITPGKTSWIIGEAVSSTLMLAVMLSRSAAQRNQNCGVLIASSALTWPAVIILFCEVAIGVLWPSGVQPGAGKRTVNAPNIITAK